MIQTKLGKTMCKNWTFFCLLVHEISKENEDITLFILSNLYLNVYLYQIYIIEIMLWNCCIKLLICLKKRLQTEITEYCPLQESLNGNTFQNPDNISVFFSVHSMTFPLYNIAVLISAKSTKVPLSKLSVFNPAKHDINGTTPRLLI